MSDFAKDCSVFTGSSKNILQIHLLQVQDGRHDTFLVKAFCPNLNFDPKFVINQKSTTKICLHDHPKFIGHMAPNVLSWRLIQH